MKYKDPKSGKVYGDIIQAVEAYKCPGPCNPDCPLCVAVGWADGRSVLKCHHDWAGSHPVQVSHLIGYELLADGAGATAAGGRTDTMIGDTLALLKLHTTQLIDELKRTGLALEEKVKEDEQKGA